MTFGCVSKIFLMWLVVVECKLLEDLLDGHDRREWPTYNLTATPTTVEVNIYVGHLSAIKETDMEYTMDIFLRQRWIDERFAIDNNPDHQRRTSRAREGEVLGSGSNSGDHVVTFSDPSILENMWKPDTYFSNAKHAEGHDITVPNFFLRFNLATGEILYSRRVTVRAQCNMDLTRYPFDSQSCSLIVESYSYITDHVLLEWRGWKPLMVSEDINMPQFVLAGYHALNCSGVYDTGTFSCLKAHFHFQRSVGFYVLQQYVPTVLIVMISWVSFWLDPESAPARITLGVTTLLTVTTLSSGIKHYLPPVSYVKAMDVWVGACIVFVFGALVEFTVVSYLSRKPGASPGGEMDSSSITHRLSRWVQRQVARPGRYDVNGSTSQQQSENNMHLETFHRVELALQDQRSPVVLQENQPAPAMFSNGHTPTTNQGVTILSSNHRLTHPSQLTRDDPWQVTTKSYKQAKCLDSMSRKIFPVSFLMFNLFYWPFYIYWLEDATN